MYALLGNICPRKIWYKQQGNTLITSRGNLKFWISELKGGDLQCDRCEFSTNTYKSLNIHISIVHNSDNPRPETVMVKKEGKDGEYIVYKKGSKAPAACSECDFVAADSGMGSI